MPAKRSNATPAEKLLMLYTLLIRRGERPSSLTELAGMLQCSKQTVLRLLAQLEASGYGKLEAPIRRGREHCYRLAFGLHDLCGDARELAWLTFYRQMLQQFLPQGMGRLWNDGAIAEGAESLHLSPAEVLPLAAGGADIFFPCGIIDYPAFAAQYRCLLLALRQRHLCRVLYRESLRQEESCLYFAPLRLVIRRDSLSFLGWRMEDAATQPAGLGKPVSLFLHRCLHVEMTERSTAALPLPGGGIAGQDEADGREKSPFRVRVLFAEQEADYVYDRRWSLRQDVQLRADGSLLLDFDAGSEGEVLAWLLSFGSRVVVLEPAWLREKIQQQARLMLHACRPA